MIAHVFALAAPATAAPAVSIAGELARVLLGLLAIIAMIVAAGWLTRRLQARTTSGGRRIRCVETYALSTRERVLLLEADGKRLLVGVGQGGLRTLHVYEGPVEISSDEFRPGAVTPAPAFAELLGRWKRKP